MHKQIASHIAHVDINTYAHTIFHIYANVKCDRQPVFFFFFLWHLPFFLQKRQYFPFSTFSIFICLSAFKPYYCTICQPFTATGLLDFALNKTYFFFAFFFLTIIFQNNVTPPTS